MKEIKRKLNILENIWRNRFWDNNYLLKEIKYEKKSLSNYPGVVFGYLGDTIPAIKSYLKIEVKEKEGLFLTTVGLLQIIYIQQDLIDELLQVFKLQKSSLSDKDPNRTIRNDLAGHPIRRQRTNEEPSAPLKSYSLFSYETTKNTIQFSKYRKETNFTFELEDHDVLALIDRHKKFLEKYLNTIFRKVVKILYKFAKLNNELLDVQSKIDFPRLVDQVYKRFNNFFKEDFVFEKEYIKLCWEKKKQHPRYQYSVDKFNAELSYMIKGVIGSIGQLEKEWHSADGDNSERQEFSDSYNGPNLVHNPPIIDQYELSKLYDNHLIFGIAYFKEKFSNNPEILEELDNMEIHKGSNEFYCSYNYLVDVLLKHGIFP